MMKIDNGLKNILDLLKTLIWIYWLAQMEVNKEFY